MNDEEEFIFVQDNQSSKKCDYLPYTPWRIKRILKEDYDCRLENIYQGYKANRQKGYCELYRIIQNWDDKVICERTSLHALRKCFAREGFPLQENSKRCIGAENFLAFVEEHKKHNL